MKLELTQTSALLAPALSAKANTLQVRDAHKEKRHMKNYQLINRKTGKLSGRKFWTREEARVAKRNAGFKHSIFNLQTLTIVR